MEERIFCEADEKFVKAKILYGKDEDKVLYFDAKHTKKVNMAAFAEMQFDNILIEHKGIYCRPVTIKKVSTTHIEATILTTAGSVTAVTFKTAEK